MLPSPSWSTCQYEMAPSAPIWQPAGLQRCGRSADMGASVVAPHPLLAAGSLCVESSCLLCRRPKKTLGYSRGLGGDPKQTQLMWR